MPTDARWPIELTRDEVQSHGIRGAADFFALTVKNAFACRARRRRTGRRLIRAAPAATLAPQALTYDNFYVVSVLSAVWLRKYRGVIQPDGARKLSKTLYENLPSPFRTGIGTNQINRPRWESGGSC